MKIDLHSHTSASDGTLSPSELVARAALQQVSVLAITDHDTLDGLAEARSVAEAEGIQLVDGVEISTRWQSFEIHVVGLGFDREDPGLLALLKRQQQARADRAEQIGAKLAKKGIEGVFEAASTLARGQIVGRAHFARVLLDRGLVRDQQHAFDKYLGKGQAAYVANPWCEMAEAIDAIQAAGGVAVLAHPAKYRLSNKWLRRLIDDFHQAGGLAMEAIHCQQPPQQREFLLELARERDLMISAGSDFHFPGRWCELGRNLQRPEQPGVWHHFGWVEQQPEKDFVT